MSRVRILVTSTGGAGHVGPLLPVVQRLIFLGHDVQAVVAPAAVRAVGLTGAAVQGGAAPSAKAMGDVLRQLGALPPAEASVLANRDIFGKLLADALRPAVLHACTTWRPDVVLHEAAEFAGPQAAESLGIRHVQVAIGLAEVEHRSLSLAEPSIGGSVAHAIRVAPYLTRLPQSLDPSPYPQTVRFRDTQISAVAAGGDWDDVPPGPEPLVLVSFGTLVGRQPAGVHAYGAVVRALQELPVRALVSTGRTIPADHFHDLARTMRVVDWMPPLATAGGLNAALAITHGGAGSLFGALASSLPQVVVPFMADQPANGQLIEQAAAGLVVPPLGDNLTHRLREAIWTLLTDEAFTSAARIASAQVHNLPHLDDAIGQALA